MNDRQIVPLPQEQVAIEDVKRLANIVLALRNDVFKEGHDYGKIPGAGEKPTLLQPGMEKLMRALRVKPRYTEVCVIRDYDKPLFHYEYKCELVDVDTGLVIPGAEANGLCTSMESKYRYRKASRICPTCGKEAIIRGKQDYGGGWLCFKNKGGCGAKFKDGDKSIESQSEGRVVNEDIFDQINTICKMAQKRALGSAIKGAANVSEFFTVDLEDFQRYDTTPVTIAVSHDDGRTAETTGEVVEASPEPDLKVVPPVAKSAPAPEPPNPLGDFDARIEQIPRTKDDMEQASGALAWNIGEVKEYAILTKQYVKGTPHFDNLRAALEREGKINNASTTEQVKAAIDAHYASKPDAKKKAS